MNEDKDEYSITVAATRNRTTKHFPHKSHSPAHSMKTWLFSIGNTDWDNDTDEKAYFRFQVVSEDHSLLPRPLYAWMRSSCMPARHTKTLMCGWPPEAASSALAPHTCSTNTNHLLQCYSFTVRHSSFGGTLPPLPPHSCICPWPLWSETKRR